MVIFSDTALPTILYSLAIRDKIYGPTPLHIVVKVRQILLSKLLFCRLRLKFTILIQLLGHNLIDQYVLQGPGSMYLLVKAKPSPP